LGVVGASDVAGASAAVGVSPCAWDAADRPLVAEEPALAEAGCEAPAVGVWAPGALPDAVPGVGAAVGEDPPVPAAPGTDDGPEPGCAVASDSIVDAGPDAVPGAPRAPSPCAPPVPPL
jgi:hypothetical protein